MAVGPRRRFEATCHPYLQMALGPKRYFEATCYPHLRMLRSVRSWKWGKCVYRNVGLRLPIDAASRNRRSESSTRQTRHLVCCDCELATEQNLSRRGHVSVRFITGTLPRRRGFCLILWIHESSYVRRTGNTTMNTTAIRVHITAKSCTTMRAVHTAQRNSWFACSLYYRLCVAVRGIDKDTFK